MRGQRIEVGDLVSELFEEGNFRIIRYGLVIHDDVTNGMQKFINVRWFSERCFVGEEELTPEDQIIFDNLTEEDHIHIIAKATRSKQ
jgi:hypothetical protein